MFDSSSKTDTLEAICFSDVPTSKKRKLIERYLLAKGDINVLSGGQTVLHQLSQDRDTEIDLVRHLLEKGASIETPEGESALFAAITSYSPEIATLLLQHGARLDFHDNQGRSWLHCFFDLPESPVYTHAQRSTMLELLLANGLDINQPVLFHPEAEKRHPVDILLEKQDRFLLMRLFHADSPVRLTGTSILETVFRHAGSWMTLEVFQPIVAQAEREGMLESGFTLSFNQTLKNQEQKTSVTWLELALHCGLPAPCCAFLLDRFPDMRCDVPAHSVLLDALERSFPPALIRRIAERTADLDRRYPLRFEQHEPDDDEDDAEYERDAERGNDVNQGTVLAQYLVLRAKAAVTDSRVQRVFSSSLEHLLESGASPNIGYTMWEEEDDTPTTWPALYTLCEAMIATGQYHADLLDLLLAHGADFNQQHVLQESGALPLGMALLLYLQPGPHESVLLDIFRHLHSCGMNLHSTAPDGMNMVYAAAAGCRPLVLNWLIQQGVGLNAETASTLAPPLHRVIDNTSVTPERRKATLEVLLQQGIEKDVAWGEPAMTPLMLAAKQGAQHCLEVLLHYGANPNARIAGGMTPALCAITSRRSVDFPPRPESVSARMLAILHAYGADLRQSNDDGVTPLSLSVQDERKEIFEALLRLTPFTEAQLRSALDGKHPVHAYFAERLQTLLALPALHTETGLSRFAVQRQPTA
ncbi:ankyrin repeat domain-containing protein [Pectobacterium carotovorum]|uniref:ankyrin repeat domain-containing protein n=1 Tax=Pectobacterium carotovorum TaxID=554 RepID=UPI0029DCE4A1|nr:ankyrin repeat domain-containing protein [Pectobacterium carotovorum]MDX6917699.1 ankyrin repeat domain-containing protein [Pectobacterium carotovorum]